MYVNLSKSEQCDVRIGSVCDKSVDTKAPTVNLHVANKKRKYRIVRSVLDDFNQVVSMHVQQ